MASTVGSPTRPGAWSVAGLTLASVVAVVAVVLAVTVHEGSSRWTALPAVAYVGLASVLVFRGAGGAVAWLLAALGVEFGLSEIVAVAPAEGSEWGDRAGVALFVAFAATAALLFQLFPTGRPAGRVGRVVEWALVVGTGTLVAGYVTGIKPPERGFAPVMVPAVLAGVLYAGGLLASVPLLALRYHRARDVERAQLKWFLFSVVLALVAWFQPAFPLLFVLCPLIPLAGIAVAVLRYHLFEIDRLVSRTAAYTIVTLLLVSSVVAVVLSAQRLFPQRSQFSVAAATLLAAAAARPLQRLIQDRVDRRFNRARYDAQRVVEVFGHQLRSQVGTGAVENELRSVVWSTLQPHHVAVWLRER